MHSVVHRALEEGDTAGLRYLEKILSSLFGLLIRVGMCLTPVFLLWLEKPRICLSTDVLHFCFFPILEFNQICKKDPESTYGANRKRKALGHPVLFWKERSEQIGS